MIGAAFAGAALVSAPGCSEPAREAPGRTAGSGGDSGAAGAASAGDSARAAGGSTGGSEQRGVVAAGMARDAGNARPGPKIAPDAGGVEASPCLDFSTPRVVGDIDLGALDQLSGLVASRTQPGVLFAHEDSTGAALVYALDANGHTLAAFTLAGAPSTDWEDIAVGSGPDGDGELFIGDIGDNPVRNGGTPRDEIQVIRLPEPSVNLAQPFAEATLSSFDVLRFRYPNGVHEAETLLVEPTSGDLVIVTRSATGDSLVYRAAGTTPPDTLTELQEIGQLKFAPSGQGALATAGDIAPSGDRILIRTYTDVYLWPIARGSSLGAALAAAPRVIPWGVAPQGEGISFTVDGHAWLAAGEQESAIYRADEACPR